MTAVSFGPLKKHKLTSWPETQKKIEAEVEELNKDISQLEDLGYEIWLTDKDGVLSINAPEP